jgi:hypothetical protein
LLISFGSAAWLRVVQAVSLPLLFVPIALAAYVGLPPEKGNSAAGLINFMRNIGSSIGTSWQDTRPRRPLGPGASDPGTCFDAGARSAAAMRYLVGGEVIDRSMSHPTGRRRAIVAFFLSGVFPGLGQFYNHEPLKGGAFLVAGIALSWLIGRMVPTDLMALASASMGIDAILLLCLLLAIWLWSAIDAWRAGMR